MLTVVIIVAIVCVAFIMSVFLMPQLSIGKRKVDTYWIVPLLGAIALIVTNRLTLSEVWQGLTADSSVNPLQILVLFFSMTIMSVYLDEAGFFRYIANRTAQRSNGNQSHFFMSLYAVISILTVFTSNDIIILTFTPFVCYFCKHAKISPLPYLIMEFVAANTWSMLLIIGNPTNIYLAAAHNINFVDYLRVMILPTVTAGLVSLGLIRLIFAKQLRQQVSISCSEVTIESKFLLIAPLVALSLCVICLVVSSFVPALKMWVVALTFALALIAAVLIYRISHRAKPSVLVQSFVRLPLLLIPFVLSMFVVVQAMTKFGITTIFADLLGQNNQILTYGIVSFLCSNVLNNIPMSVLFSQIVTTKSEVFAVIIASNIAALLTPVGALAGMMWSSIITKNNIDMRVTQFVKYGSLIAIPTLLLSLLALTLSLALA